MIADAQLSLAGSIALYVVLLLGAMLIVLVVIRGTKAGPSAGRAMQEPRSHDSMRRRP